MFEVPASFILSRHHLCIFTSISRQNQSVGGVENLLDIRVSVCYILNTYKIGKHDLFVFITLGVTPFSFSNCTEELSLRTV